MPLALRCPKCGEDTLNARGECTNLIWARKAIHRTGPCGCQWTFDGAADCPHAYDKDSAREILKDHGEV